MSFRSYVLCLFLVSCAVSLQAMPNVTCAATHECHPVASIMTVVPVFSSSSSLLDEAVLGRPLRFLDSPLMRPAEFPSFANSIDDVNPNLLTSAASVEGFLTRETDSDLGMF